MPKVTGAVFWKTEITKGIPIRNGDADREFNSRLAKRTGEAMQCQNTVVSMPPERAG